MDAERHHPDPAPHGDAWVAVVDDDTWVRSAVARLLQSEGVRVATFATAQDFLAAAARSAPSGVILDDHLGGASAMNGVELHAHLCRGGWSVPTVLMSAHDDTPGRRTAHPGLAGHLRKPFDGDALIQLMWKALAR